MFSNVLIAFLVALGLSAWVYNKMSHHSGVTSTAIKVTIAVGILIFIVVLLIASSIQKL